MERTQIYLSRQQAAALDREARSRGQTRSHLIREAIDKVYLSDASTGAWEEALDASFGAWTGRTESGETYVEKLRSGRRLQALWRDGTAEGDAPE